jgi:peptide subunit release factor 1 (eRF1)
MITDKEIVKELSGAKSPNTNLITLLVAAGTDLKNITSLLVKELSTSQNIKDKNVRKQVGVALNSLLCKIRLINSKSITNGLVLCAGNSHNWV